MISAPRSVSLCYVVSNFPNQVFVVILHSLISEMLEARLRHSKVGLDSLKFPSVICRSLKGIIRLGEIADVCTKEEGFPLISTQLIFLFISLGPEDFNQRPSQNFPVNNFYIL